MQKSNRLREKLGHLGTQLGIETTEDVLVVALRMFILLLLFHMKDNNPLIIFMPVIVVPGLLVRKIILNKWYWIIYAALTVYFYLIMDLVNYVPNHRHIFAYLSIGVLITLFLYSNSLNALNFLSVQAKNIIGICFLFATIGKFLAPEFLDGSFFEFTNLIDPRFFGFTSNMAGIDMSSLLENGRNFERFLATEMPQQTVSLNSSQRLESVGLILSYWTIFIEGMTAISFVLPQRFLLSKYRDLFLVTFIITTYPIATVTGFALVLATMGFMQSLREGKMTGFSWFYLLVYVLIPLNYIPFAKLFSGLI